MNYNIYCDGAASMKQEYGEYKRKAGGWAWALINPEKTNVISSDSGREDETTNNRMELFAINECLKYAQDNLKDAQEINIHSDSSYCINIYTQWIKGWETNGWTRGAKHLPIENVELIKETWKRIRNFEENLIKVNFIKVRGHANDKWNIFVDHLAVGSKKEEF